MPKVKKFNPDKIQHECSIGAIMYGILDNNKKNPDISKRRYFTRETPWKNVTEWTEMEKWEWLGKVGMRTNTL